MHLLRWFAVFLGAWASTAWAHDPITTNLTWSKEISRLVYQHCASCHRPDGRAMSLLTYEEARPWAKAIRDEVLNRRMPPWDAVKGVGQFRDDASLSQPEMDLLVSWVEGGAPEGNPIYLPARAPASDPVVERAGKGITLRQSTTLTSAMTLSGIRPEGSVELSAILPDRSVHHLIWVPVFRPEWNRTYYLRTPLRLPKGTKIVLSGEGVRLE
jgi:mono/diheme cytochrome c family protein